MWLQVFYFLISMELNNFSEKQINTVSFCGNKIKQVGRARRAHGGTPLEGVSILDINEIVNDFSDFERSYPSFSRVSV